MIQWRKIISFDFHHIPKLSIGFNFILYKGLVSFKVATTFLKLEIRLHTYQIGTNARSGTEVMFTLIWLAHAFGIMLLSM